MNTPKISFKFTNETIMSEQYNLTIITHVPNMQKKHKLFVEKTANKRFNNIYDMLDLISFLVD